MVSDDPEGYAYPEEVRWVLPEKERPDYRRLACQLNESDVRAVSLQHEYGIFGGPCGSWLLDLLDEIRIPVVTTCHTVLKEPSDLQKQVLQEIVARSARVVVMAEKGREFLREIYGAPPEKIAVIPHGIPDITVGAGSAAAVRSRHGWDGRRVILTFGLLSPNKGIEIAIRSLPQIVREHPDALYVVLGATHPNLTRNGDPYRDGLQQLVAELGMHDHVQFVNRFVTREELVAFIAAADIYTTPYLNEAQITSGTLAYAFGLGKPVISTPYWYAAELLRDGAGVLVPFNDSAALGDAAAALLADSERRQKMGELARERGQAMAWSEVGRAYSREFEAVLAQPQRHPVRLRSETARVDGVPPVSLRHLHQLTGAYGIFQHAKLAEPDPAHGFCTDDNARAAIFLSDLAHAEAAEKDSQRTFDRCLSQLFSAYNDASGRFRNFMDSNGRWQESSGSEDSHGRALWALGHIIPRLNRRREAACGLFYKALHTARSFTSPRAWAFALLGIADFRTFFPEDPGVQRTQEEFAGRLLRLFRLTGTPDWQWFEPIVTYDNAKLPQALLVTSRQLCRPDLRIVALASLNFLLQGQAAPEGWFRPVGCRGFWRKGQAPAQFDQQPIEVQAMVAACLEAEQVTGDEQWLEHAQRIYAWFHGHNDLGVAMANAATGASFDGLQEADVNLNQGAESTLAYLQSTLALREALATRRPLTRCYPAAWRTRSQKQEQARQEQLRAAS
jgi:glycosyltransferase involved in cell wall biosynthesis